ncbi:hypothetical protein PRIC2_001714 [Phytophthora ramorum]
MAQSLEAAETLLSGVNASLPDSSSSDGSAGHVRMGDLTVHERQSIEFYLYVFLGVVVALAVGSITLYCVHQRRLQRFEQDDNSNNNMQRHLLEDSVIQDGQAEWQCSVCYHENHPSKRDCLLCGTPEASDLRQRLRIEFIDEPGLDAGGLLREWVLLLCEQLFDESYGLFQRTHADQSGYWINPNSREIHRDHLHCFQFVGRLLAKCLLEGQLMTVHLALPLLKHLLGVPISFSDLEFLDAELHRHALWLRDNEGAEALALDFTVQRQANNGTVITEELKQGGKDIPVTDANKEEYLTLLLRHKMFAGVHDQLEALLQGLYDVLPRTLLAVFDYQEMELLLCGVPSIDVADWESHTDVRYMRAEQGLNRSSSPERQVVQWFWTLCVHSPRKSVHVYYSSSLAPLGSPPKVSERCSAMTVVSVASVFR